MEHLGNYRRRTAANFRDDSKQFGGIFLAVALATAFITFAVFEIQNIKISLERSRLESKCKDVKVDIEACGDWAHTQVTAPRDEQEMIAGRQLLNTLCKDGDASACRRFSFTGVSKQLEHLTYRDLSEELWTRCQNEGAQRVWR